MSETLMLIGSNLISNPDKIKQVIQVVKDTQKDISNELGEFGNEAVNVFKDFQDYICGRQSVPQSATVMIYNNPGGHGAYRGLNTGDAISNFCDMHYQEGLSWHKWNDKVSAIKIMNGIAAAFYEHAAYGGNRLLILGPASILNLEDIGWTDTISSCKIVPATNTLELFN